MTVLDKADKIALDMPLCSVEVPRRTAPGVVQKAQKLAGESLEIAHKQLGVPDPEDLEINVIEGEGEQTKFLVSYTIGPNEYPDFPSPSFSPTKRPQLRLIVSPEKQQGLTALPREAEPTTELGPDLKFIEDVGKKLSEVLGLPEDSPIPVHVQPTLFADTDFAVVFDCQPISGYQISEEARIYMAQVIEQELNQNPSTRDGSAEVWVRQGQPARHHFVGK